jgi:hypothetical protein
MFKIIFAIIVGGVGVAVGYGVGFTGGIGVSAVTSNGTGMCMAIDTGVSQGLFKGNQIGQIGAGMVQLRQKQGIPAADIKSSLQNYPSNPSPACEQFREAMSKASS